MALAEWLQKNEEKLFNQARPPKYGRNYISNLDQNHIPKILNYFALFNSNALNLNAEKETFLCGLHPRLGAKSPVNQLPQDVARYILNLAAENNDTSKRYTL